MQPFGLTLFFTKGVSLGTWDSVGMIGREIAIYRKLQESGYSVQFVTYGGKQEARFRQIMDGINLVHNLWNLPMEWYVRSLPRSLFKGKRQIYKSNQVNGAEVAQQMAANRGAHFVARCGYLLSYNEMRKYGEGSAQHRQAVALEKGVFEGAEAVIVTTPKIRDQVLSVYDVFRERIHVIPNYVETEHFAPLERKNNDRLHIGFLGRLDTEKDPRLFLEAVKDLDAQIEIIGDGPMRAEMEAAAQGSRADVRFLGNMPHHELPTILNGWDIFLMTSHYEGHPKALIEAMSCGLPVVASRVPGIQELINEGDDGLLVEPEAHAFRQAIQRLMGDGGLRMRLGKAARQRVQDDFSLDRVVQLELAVYNCLLETDA